MVLAAGRLLIAVVRGTRSARCWTIASVVRRRMSSRASPWPSCRMMRSVQYRSNSSAWVLSGWSSVTAMLREQFGRSRRLKGRARVP